MIVWAARSFVQHTSGLRWHAIIFPLEFIGFSLDSRFFCNSPESGSHIKKLLPVCFVGMRVSFTANNTFVWRTGVTSSFGLFHAFISITARPLIYKPGSLITQPWLMLKLPFLPDALFSFMTVFYPWLTGRSD